jgi:xanthine dehydrogenase accessory factor
MNLSLVDHILTLDRGVLVTILTTEGHTYKKVGDKALFTQDNPMPVFGNLGSLCVDQHILIEGRKAVERTRPAILDIDTTEPEDIHFGYGTYCGGKMKILIEPVFERHKSVYRELRCCIERRESPALVHDMQTGELCIVSTAPVPMEHLLIETVQEPLSIFIFGATPLARRLVDLLEDSPFTLHVVDWRDNYLETFRSVPYVKRMNDAETLDDGVYVLLLSHSFERDSAVLERALRSGAAYIGLLSSKARRDKMFEGLVAAGIERRELKRISSPVGIDIGARSDAEIAVSIAAELVEVRNR